MKRSTHMNLARDTVKIVERGFYKLDDGRAINLAQSINSCLAGTRHFLPDDLEQLRNEILSRRADANKTTIEVRNETTLAGIARLLGDGAGPVAALNFASAKNPGGGFLNGSQAQEESLARSSALHASLVSKFEFYERHRASPSCLYSDAMILSPNCPVFRDDEGELLAEPFAAAFITSAAPNAGAIATNTPHERPLIPAAFRRRSEYVLTLAAGHGYGSLVLGAWGCGVFRNDPTTVAEEFAGHLRGAWASRFRRIVFSVLDTTPGQETFEAFRRVFGRSG